jgi:hypothetical protein
MRGPGGEDASLDADAARVRLEDLLLSLPYERALPDLPILLGRAGVPEELLRRDDRLLKILHEAILARPLAQLSDAEGVRTEVELLTLEVEVLTDRLADPATPQDVVADVTARLAEVTERLEQVRDVL